ncbi:MAG TPA: outer membrane beta-barrel protein [Steroidobacteraceae bacterium]|nr:outer membrane beta-barrel protein [Steroidobacteraceae bacterium]
MMRPAILIATLCFASAVQAQEGDDPAPIPGFEMTAFGGYRFGGELDLADPDEKVAIAEHSSFAVALDLARDDRSQYELFYSRQPTRLKHSASIGPMPLKIEYLQIGGTLLSNWPGPINPYMAGTAGITRITPDSPGTDASTDFSLSLGAGLRMPIVPHLALRLEARGYMTFIGTNSAFQCASGPNGGACRVLASGSSMLQFELLAGASFSF